MLPPQPVVPMNASATTNSTHECWRHYQQHPWMLAPLPTSLARLLTKVISREHLYFSFSHFLFHHIVHVLISLLKYNWFFFSFIPKSTIPCGIHLETFHGMTMEYSVWNEGEMEVKCPWNKYGMSMEWGWNDNRMGVKWGWNAHVWNNDEIRVEWRWNPYSISWISPIPYLFYVK